MSADQSTGLGNQSSPGGSPGSCTISTETLTEYSAWSRINSASSLWLILRSWAGVPLTTRMCVMWAPFTNRPSLRPGPGFRAPRVQNGLHPCEAVACDRGGQFVSVGPESLGWTVVRAWCHHGFERLQARPVPGRRSPFGN